MIKYLWLAVTPDEYEFPILIEDTAQKLAKKLNVTTSTIICSVTRNQSGRNSGRKIVKVEFEEERND